ncbi:MAG: DUF4199 domain-containing protein [Pseudomonadota bacterium]
MTRYSIIYGGLAGVIIIGAMALSLALTGPDGEGASQWLGYLIMLLALSLVFLGIRQYRDRELGGVISFGKAAIMGLMIAVVAGIAYVASWEVYLAATDHAFIDDYASALLEKKEAAGLGAEALAKEAAKLDAMKANYANPLYRMPVTFLEIFPVGLIVALVSAFILRTRRR